MACLSMKGELAPGHALDELDWRWFSTLAAQIELWKMMCACTQLQSLWCNWSGVGLFLKDSPGDSIVQPGLRFPSTWPKQEGGRENSDRIGGLVVWWEMRGKGELIWMVVGRCCLCRDDQWGVAGAQRSQGLLAKESLAFNFRLFAVLHYNTTLELQILSESLYMPNLVSTILW